MAIFLLMIVMQCLYNDIRITGVISFYVSEMLKCPRYHELKQANNPGVIFSPCVTVPRFLCLGHTFTIAPFANETDECNAIQLGFRKVFVLWFPVFCFICFVCGKKLELNKKILTEKVITTSKFKHTILKQQQQIQTHKP